MGRPSSYDDAKADQICADIAAGMGLEKAAKKAGTDARSVYRWLNANPGFRQKYASARCEQAETYADQIVDIADDLDAPGDAADRRLRVDARKWVCAKLLPKKYGDRVQTEISGPDGEPVTFRVVIGTEGNGGGGGEPDAGD